MEKLFWLDDDMNIYLLRAFEDKSYNGYAWYYQHTNASPREEFFLLTSEVKPSLREAIKVAIDKKYVALHKVEEELCDISDSINKLYGMYRDINQGTESEA